MDLESGFGATKDGHLSLHGADLVELCREYDTPLFVFDEMRIRGNFRRFRDAFEKFYPKVSVCYSIKTNNNIAICKIMKEEGAFAEVGSGLDLHIARAAGFPPNRIVFDGLYKPEAVLREAVSRGVLLVNVESYDELELVNGVAKELDKKQSIGIRISTFPKKRLNPEDIYCNPLSRFGFPIEETLEAFKRASELENLEVKGIMIHPYWGIHWFLPLVNRVQAELNIKLQYVNFGGGFEKPGTVKIGISDLTKDYIRQKLGLQSKLDSIAPKKIREIEEAGRLISEETKRTLGSAESTLVFEPGRFLVHDAGFLLLRIGVIKKASGFKWIIVDGGCNLNSDWLERRKIRLVNRASSPATETANVVGPLLFARDFVTIKQKLPEARIGDILAVSNSGAYTLSNSTQFLSPRPHAVLVRPDGKAVKIRARETYADVMRMDEDLNLEKMEE